jgi:hypothetical protein
MTTECLPKRWMTFNIRRGLSLKAEILKSTLLSELKTLAQKRVRLFIYSFLKRDKNCFKYSVLHVGLLLICLSLLP